MFVWLATFAHAQDFGQELQDTARHGDLGALPPFAGRPDGAPVVGGRQVVEGRWDDAVGVVFSGAYVGCTGTLIGPRVVITAGHCIQGANVTHVLVGSKDWLEEGGELLEVEDSFEYPDSWATYDVGLLTLKTASSVAPRPLAVECVLTEHLRDGAAAQIVGFGVTEESGTGWNTELNEAATTVLDKNCDETEINGILAGCNETVSPGGELAAGGSGTDACYGDSGGPLYLKTDDGNFLVGVTSRAFLGVPASAPCRDGGIWVRPDAVLDWIEETAGNLRVEMPVCNVAPEAELPAIEVWTNAKEHTSVRLSVDDPDGDADDATVEVTTEPEHGTVEIDGFDVTYVPDDGYDGDDTFALTVTDAGAPEYERTGDPVGIEVWADVTVHEGRPPLFSGCQTAPAAATGWLALGLALALRRRSSVAR